MIDEELTYKVRGAIFSVFRELGPGLLESVYERALAMELEDIGLPVEAQVPVRTFYKDRDLGLGFKLDLLVDKKIILEVKSVAELHDIHKKQLLNYLKLTHMRIGFLVNFNAPILKDSTSLIRIVN